MGNVVAEQPLLLVDIVIDDEMMVVVNVVLKGKEDITFYFDNLKKN